MPTISHTTLNSYPGRNDDSYWVSFNYHRKYAGHRLDVFKGRFNGKGCHSSEFAVAKIPRNYPGTEDWCDIEISKNRKTHELIKCFQSFFHIKSKHGFDFCDSWKALMDDISIMNKRIQSVEWVVLEPLLARNLDLFINSSGVVNWEGCELLQLFVHWSYAATNGRLVLCNFQGIYEDAAETFKLKTPTIHSVDDSYGDTDMGEPGIMQVFKNHQCTNICGNWLLPTSKCCENTLVTTHRPSAPCLPVYSMQCLPEVRIDYSQGPPSYSECNIPLP